MSGSATAPRPGLTLRRVFAIVAALGVGALLLECSARVYLFGPAGLHPARVDSVRPIFQTDLLAPAEDPGVGYRVRPNLDLWFKLARLQTNSRGLRYRELEPAKPAGTFRVAVIGSSFTFPAGVVLEDSFHARLERRFQQGTGLPIEFVNFSIGVFHPSQNMALLESEALGYQPDLVLFGLPSMGARTAISTNPAQPIIPQAPTHPFFESFLWKLVQVRRGIDVAPPELVFGEAPQNDGRDVVTRLGDFQRRTGVPVVVTRLEFVEHPESKADLRLRRRVLAQSLHYVDTRAPFAGIDTDPFWIHELDPHPNADAHALIARHIGDYLELERLVPGPDGRVGPAREAQH